MTFNVPLLLRVQLSTEPPLHGISRSCSYRYNLLIQIKMITSVGGCGWIGEQGDVNPSAAVAVSARLEGGGPAPGGVCSWGVPAPGGYPSMH